MRSSHHLHTEPQDPNMVKISIESFPGGDQSLSDVLAEHEELIKVEIHRSGNLGTVVNTRSRIVTDFYVVKET